MKSDKDVQEDLKHLANGINFAIASLNDGKMLEFLLILVRPDKSGEHVTLNTITGITDSDKIRQIGEHLVDMANAHGNPQLDPDDDNEVKGHA